MNTDLDTLMDITLETLESVDLRGMPNITLVCGAGLGVDFGIPAFNGKNGVLQSKSAALDVLDGIENSYVRFRDRDNEIVCGVRGKNGSKTEILFKHILSNNCLDRLPAFFYSFLGTFFSEDKLSEARQKARNTTSQTYVDFIEFLQGYCDVKHKRCNIFTLNIDGTLEALKIHATEIHGRMGRDRCSVCGNCAVGLYPYIARKYYSGTTEQYLERYKCPQCGGYIRPDIVLMDEDEPQVVLGALLQSLQSSACIISVGVNEYNHIGQMLIGEARAGGRCLMSVTENGVEIKERGGAYANL